MAASSDLESMSTLLISACALQGLRLTDYRDTQHHRELYEHVRNVLAPVLLVSPLPMEFLCALAIVALWSMAPNLNVSAK